MNSCSARGSDPTGSAISTLPRRRLVLDSSFWRGNLTGADILQAFGKVVAGDLILTFDKGNVLEISDFAAINKLAAAIDVI